MPVDRVMRSMQAQLDSMSLRGARKGDEYVFSSVVKASRQSGHDRGPRFILEGKEGREFLRMNSNSYLGLSFQEKLIAAEDQAVRNFGSGPGAVRFISGTWAAHTALERQIAEFHQRESAMLFSSAYATVMGVLPSLITDNTIVISDELNHNCIINAIVLGRPGEKKVYQHLDLNAIADLLRQAVGKFERAIVVTDGIFSMRGDHAPLREIMALANEYDSQFAGNVVVVVDDSHGVGAFGESGRGTEEHTDATPVDLLIGTLGKAFGVNGGYVTGSRVMTDYLREVSPFYIYSNPITPAEAATALCAFKLVDSEQGRLLLRVLRQRTQSFAQGVHNLGFEIISSEHPIVPLMVRNASRTESLVKHLFDNDVLVTGLSYPVVPSGQEEIRFQVSADQTAHDIAEVLDVLSYVRPGILER